MVFECKNINKKKLKLLLQNYFKTIFHFSSIFKYLNIYHYFIALVCDTTVNEALLLRGKTNNFKKLREWKFSEYEINLF